MKKNKITKFGTITALGLLLLVGGVYATWDYATGAAASATGSNNSLKLAGMTSATEKGTLSIGGSIAFEFDDNYDGGTADFYGDLVVSGTGTVLTYKPVASVEKSVKESGVPLLVKFENQYADYDFDNDGTATQFIVWGEGSNSSYDNGNLVIKEKNDKDITISIPTESLKKGSDGSFSYTITKDIFSEIFTVAKDANNNSVVYLPSVDDYNKFNSALKASDNQFKITLSEDTSATTGNN